MSVTVPIRSWDHHRTSPQTPQSRECGNIVCFGVSAPKTAPSRAKTPCARPWGGFGGWGRADDAAMPETPFGGLPAGRTGVVSGMASATPSPLRPVASTAFSTPPASDAPHAPPPAVQATRRRWAGSPTPRWPSAGRVCRLGQGRLPRRAETIGGRQ